MCVARIIQFNSEIKSYSVDSGSTVAELFEIAEIDYVQGDVTRRGSTVNEDTIVMDGDDFFNGKKVKGNNDPFVVEFIRLGANQRVIQMPASDGYTIKQTLDQLPEADRASFYRPDGTAGYDFRIGAMTESAGLNYVIPRPTDGKVRVICSQLVKGNE